MMRTLVRLGLVSVVAAVSGCDNTLVVPQTSDSDGPESGSTGDNGVGSGSASIPEPADDGGGEPDTGDVPPIEVCGDGIRNGDEMCDGTDLGDQDCSALGGVGVLRCTDTCTFDECKCIWDESPSCGPPVCGNGLIEADEACDGDAFAGWEFQPECADVLGAGAQGELSCSDCMIDTSSCAVCGDGVVQRDYEVCEPMGEPTACSDVLGPGYEGVLGCDEQCDWDMDPCTPLCGNGVLDDGEACEGAMLDGASCESLGHVGGTLGCTGNCTLSQAACHDCGDGVQGPGEDCDGEDLGGLTCADLVVGATGSLVCSATCGILTTNCEGVVPVWDGQPIISEIMVASAADPDFNPGEWLEVYNSSPDGAFDLHFCELRGTAPFETITFTESLTIPPGGYITLAHGTAETLGFTPDFALPSQVTFLNGGDTIRLVCGGIVRDEVVYSDETPWPAFAAGVAIATIDGVSVAADNDEGEAWCAASNVYALSQQGTPGAPNDCG